MADEILRLIHSDLQDMREEIREMAATGKQTGERVASIETNMRVVLGGEGVEGRLPKVEKTIGEHQVFVNRVRGGFWVFTSAGTLGAVGKILHSLFGPIAHK